MHASLRPRKTPETQDDCARSASPKGMVINENIISSIPRMIGIIP
jgi:hypothetical protein